MLAIPSPFATPRQAGPCIHPLVRALLREHLKRQEVQDVLIRLRHDCPCQTYDQFYIVVERDGALFIEQNPKRGGYDNNYWEPLNWRDVSDVVEALEASAQLMAAE